MMLGSLVFVHCLATANFSPSQRVVRPVALWKHSGLLEQQESNANRTAPLLQFPFTLSGPGAFAVLDFGKEVGGFTTVTFGAVTPQASVGLAYSESTNFAACPAPVTRSGTPCDMEVRPSTRPSCACEFGPHNQSGAGDHSNGGTPAPGASRLDLTLSSGAIDSHSVFRPQTAQMRGGFRYLNLFLQRAGTVVVSNVTLYFTPAPEMSNPADYKNHFHSSDALLNDIWYGCAYTTQMCTIASDQGRQWPSPPSGWNNGVLVGKGASVLVDGAKRDRTIWPGDLGISVATALATTGDVSASRNSLATLFEHQDPETGMVPYAGPPVFCQEPEGQSCGTKKRRYNSDTYHLWALVAVHQLWESTVDARWLREIYPAYAKAVKCSLRKVQTKPDPEDPTSKLPCPAGERPDTVRAAHDNGSCDCDDYCASDWSGSVKQARPHWRGAASAIPGARLDCLCVQGTHWCPRNASKCRDSCERQGKPTPIDYCIKAPPMPPSLGLMVVDQTADWQRSGQGGKNLAANALLCHVLATGSEIASLLGEHADAATFLSASTKLRAAINGPALWDEERGAFRDNPLSTVYPQDGNSLALWFNLTSAANAQHISQYLGSNLGQFGASSPEWNGDIGNFPGSMEVRGQLSLGTAEATRRGLALIRTQWGYMLEHPNSTQSTFWEGMHADGSFAFQTIYMSHAHGWATGPAAALTHHVLGIRPAVAPAVGDGRGDGGGENARGSGTLVLRQTYVVSPSPADLTACEGSLSFGGGKVGLQWEAMAHRFVMKLNATEHPAGSRALVALPVPLMAAASKGLTKTEKARLELHLDGDLVWRTRMPNKNPDHAIDDEAKDGPNPDEQSMSRMARSKGVEMIGLEPSSLPWRVRLRLSHPRYILLELKVL
eukprot:SAG31_NODE_440_length_15664_cov_8.209252_4_plen_890_part_00